MARQFSIKNVLRQTSNAIVCEMLQRLGHSHLGILWEGLAEKDIEPIYAALKGLSSTKFDAVEGVCRTVFDLACETGISAILEAAACLDDATLLAGFASLPEAGLYDRAMWAWVNRPETVELASLIHQVENLAWWRRRDDLPKCEPDTSAETRRRLGAELSTLLQTTQGRGRNCTVETLARTNTRYYFAYPDDYVQNVVTHDDCGQLTPGTFRRTFTVVFAFDAADGALELYAAKLSPRLKQQIECVFARVVFGVELGAWAKPTYTLEGLKFRDTLLVTDPADRIVVTVRQLRLKIRGTQRQITLKADPDRGPNDIYDMLEEVIDSQRLPLPALEVNLVTFCFEFLDADRGRGRTMTFEVATPQYLQLAEPAAGPDRSRDEVPPPVGDLCPTA